MPAVQFNASTLKVSYVAGNATVQMHEAGVCHDCGQYTVDFDGIQVCGGGGFPDGDPNNITFTCVWWKTDAGEWFRDITTDPHWYVTMMCNGDVIQSIVLVHDVINVYFSASPLSDAESASGIANGLEIGDCGGAFAGYGGTCDYAWDNAGC